MTALSRIKEKIEEAFKDPWSGAYAAVALIGLLVHTPVLFTRRTYFLADIFSNYAPTRALLRKFLLDFSLPMWTNGYWMGQSFIADPSTGTFYPLHLLLLLPFPWSMNFLIFIHFLIMGSGITALCRRFGLTPLAGIICGGGTVLSGYIGSMIHSGYYLVSVAWLPWVMWSFHGIFTASVEGGARRNGLQNLLLMSVFLAMQALAGDPQATFLSAFSLVVFLVVLSFSRPESETTTRRKASVVFSTIGVMILAAIVTALLLSAVQIMPTISMMARTQRVDVMDFAAATQRSFSPFRLLELLIPGIFGNPYLQNYYGYFLGGTTEKLSPWPGAVCMGAPVLALALAALPLILRRRSSRTLRSLCVISVLMILTGCALALGHHFFIYRLFFEYVPGSELFRFPFKYMLPVTIGFLLLAAVTVDRIRDEKTPGRIIASSMLLLLICMGLYAGREIIAGYLGSISGGEADVKDMCEAILTDLVPAMTALACVFFAAVMLKRSRRGLKGVWMTVVVLLSLAEEARCVVPFVYHSLPQGDLVRAPLFASGIKSDYEHNGMNPMPMRVYRPGSMKILIDEDFNLTAEGRLRMFRDSLKPNTWMENGLEHVEGFSPVASGRVKALMKSLHDRPRLYLDLMSVRYMVLPFHNVPSPDFAMPLATLKEVGINLYRINSPFSYARVVPEAEFVSSVTGALDAMRRKDFNPLEKVVLEGEDTGRNKGGSGSCTLTERRADEVLLECSAQDGGWLVLADGYGDGWSAYVDGKDSKIYPAYAALRSIWLEPGDHFVRFAYSPPGLLTGGIISLAGILMFLGAWIILL